MPSIRTSLAAALVLAGCSNLPRLLPVPCETDAECGTGAVCVRASCLRADLDYDGDGLTNADEQRLGTDPLRADTDGDNLTDRFETAEGNQRDRDDDGKPDVLEPSNGDADRDCLPDHDDADDATPETSELILRRQCRYYGACVNSYLRQTATCSDGVLTCLFDGAPYPAETCANDIDDDCDGKVDEGCPGTPLAAGASPVVAPTEGDASGVLVIEKPFALTVPGNGPLPDALRTLQLDWVTEVSARCTSRDAGVVAPKVVFRIDDTPVGMADPATLRPGEARDARGRPTHLAAQGVLRGHVALEHLAGRWALLTVQCQDAVRVAEYEYPTVSIPVRVKDKGPRGESVVLRTARTGCASTGIGWIALFPLALLRRRRAWILSGLLLAGCPSGVPRPEMLAEGDGPTNTQPLFPVGGDDRLESSTISMTEARPRSPFVDGTALHSQRRVAGGVEHWFDKGYSPNFPTELGVLVTDDGDTYLTASHYGPIDPPVLIAPKTVRVGMTWESERVFETDSLLHFIDLPLEFGDGRIRFTVTHRQVIATRFGEQVVWRIEWAGPELPYARDAYGNVWTKDALAEVPVTERNRLRGSIDFVEGVGPVALRPMLHALDAFAHSADGSIGPLDTAVGPADPDGASTLATLVFPALPADDAVLAGSTLQDVPALPVRAVADNPIVPDGLLPTALEYTRASTEPDGRLVLLGRVAGRTTFIDPDGNSSGVYSIRAVSACGRVSADGRVTGDDGEDCESRLQKQATPYVTSSGERWAVSSVSKTLEGLENLPPRSRPPQNEWPSGIEPVAPIEQDGKFLVFGARVSPSERNSLPEFRLYPAPPPDPISWPREPDQSRFGVRSFGLSFGVGGDTVQGFSFAQPLTGDIAIVRPSSVLWLTRQGKAYDLLDLRHDPLGWTNRDGTHVRVELGRMGELRRLRVDKDRAFGELLGRVALPEGHVGAFATHLGGDDYLVFTQEQPLLRYTGFIEEYSTHEGLMQAPPRTGPLHAFAVTAPATGLVDRDWMLRQVSVNVSSGVIETCVPRGSTLVVDRLRIGDRPIGPADLSTREPGCVRAMYDNDDVARTQAEGSTPLWIHVAGEGWMRRRLPSLLEGSPGTQGAAIATLPDGSLLSSSGWTSAFGVRSLPVPDRAPGTLGDLTQADTVPDRSGAGLWHLGLTPNTCRAEPCIDTPYAPEDRGDKVPYVLADRTTLRTFWAPPGATQPVSTGGLLGPGVHLEPDGTVTTVPGDERALADTFWTRNARFVDGTVCGQFAPPDQSILGCVDENRRRTRLPAYSFEDRDIVFPQEPQFLIRPSQAPGAFTLDIADVHSGDVRTFTFPAGPEGGPLQVLDGIDGTRWYLLGGDEPSLVGVRAGVVERHPLTASTGLLLAATREELLWTTGLAEPRPAFSPTTCVAQDERCNGIDDDCSGTADDGDDMCPTTGGTRTCTNGRCASLTCSATTFDCNTDPADGCETTLGTTDDCLACGDACGPGATCEATGCTVPPVAELAGGEYFVCAKNGAGDVHCLAGPWPMTTPPDYANRLRNPVNDVGQLVAGASHACVRHRDATVSCWGSADVAIGPGGSYLGLRETPVVVSGLTAVDRLWAGGTSTCARRTNGELWCWGPVIRGLVTPVDASEQALYEALRVPTRVPGLDGVQALAISGDEACVVRADGSPACFGPGASGSTTFEVREFATFTLADGVFGSTSTFAGAGLFAFTQDGDVFGRGAWHVITSLGGSASGPYTTPQRLAALSGVTGAAIGKEHACFLTPTETLCAGRNHQGQLGTTETGGIHADIVIHPSRAGGAATPDSTCLATADGRVECMGKLVEVAGFSPRRTLREIRFWPAP